ncbi:hypothetical protein [Prosthecobacter sp.]|uniref:hypothetical protein n=1 Tax=Prosthecobacter sp. TaxID=1965333 RepID=UPI003782E76E
MTVRETIATMLSYLRVEQRAIPYAGGADYDDPLPDALAACNAALQQMAVLGPLCAAKQQRSAYFRAPSTVAVSGLTRGGKTATGSFPAWAAGCWVDLPGDPAMNRILSISGSTATLQFPHLSDSSSGTATVNVDTAELDADVITVLEPVRFRGSRRRLVAVGSRDELAQDCGGEARYFVESAVANGAVKLRLMISGYVSTDTVLEFQARTALGELTRVDVYNDDEDHTDPGVALPVPANFVESIFLPLALDAFFAKPSVTNYDISSLRNQDAPALIKQQAQAALLLLQNMRPQGRKPVGVWPAWSSGRY